jgi:hypothetical protein
MKLRNKILAVAAIASTCAMISCAGPSSFSYQNVVVTVSNIALGFAGGFANNMASPGTVTGAFEVGASVSADCIQINVNVINAPANPTWTLVPGPAESLTSTGSNVGNLNDNVPGVSAATITGQTSVFFCAPSSVPTYANDQLIQAQGVITPQTPNGLPQGNIEIQVTNPADPNNPSDVAIGRLFGTITGEVVAITTPDGQPSSGNVTVPLCPTTGPIPSCQYQFAGYVAGEVDNTGNFYNPCGQPGAAFNPVALTGTTTAGSTTVNVTLPLQGSGTYLLPTVGMTIVGTSTAYGIPVANNASLVPAANTTITAVNITGGSGTITLSQPANATYSGGSMTAGNFINAVQVSWSVGSTTALQFPSPGATGAPYGSISSTGLYTAPTAYPPTVTGQTPHTAIVQDYSYACIPTPATTGVPWSASGTGTVTINFP